MAKTHRARYVGRGQDLPCGLWSTTLPQPSALWKLPEHGPFGFLRMFITETKLITSLSIGEQLNLQFPH